MINAKILLDDGETIVAIRETATIALPKTFLLRIPEMHVDFNVKEPDNPVVRPYEE